MTVDDALRGPLVEYLLRLGDDSLVLGHRLSELCGHGPILEEDIALTNISLDCIGQAEALLALAGEVEAKGRSADDLAFHRDPIDFRNALLVEQPNGDFAVTILRQALFDAWRVPLLERLSESPFEPLAAIAAKSLKEVRYHLRHSGDWVVRLAGGTDESRRRIEAALAELWPYTGELREEDDVTSALAVAGIAPEQAAVAERWRAIVSELFNSAGLDVPEDGWMARGGRTGRHSEEHGRMLNEMQSLPRAIPGAEW